jgi:hypothetical protein
MMTRHPTREREGRGDPLTCHELCSTDSEEEEEEKTPNYLAFQINSRRNEKSLLSPTSV